MASYNIFFKNEQGKISPIGIISPASPKIKTYIPDLGNIRISSKSLKTLDQPIDNFDIVDPNNKSLIDDGGQVNWKNTSIMRIYSNNKGRIGSFYKKSSTVRYIPFRVIKYDQQGLIRIAEAIDTELQCAIILKLRHKKHANYDKFRLSGKHFYKRNKSPHFPSLIKYGENYTLKGQKYDYQVLHKFEGKTLLEYTKENYFYDDIYKCFKYKKLFKIFYDLSKIIQDMHQRGFSHNNLNLGHILYNEQTQNIFIVGLTSLSYHGPRTNTLEISYTEESWANLQNQECIDLEICSSNAIESYYRDIYSIITLFIKIIMPDYKDNEDFRKKFIHEFKNDKKLRSLHNFFTSYIIPMANGESFGVNNAQDLMVVLCDNFKKAGYFEDLDIDLEHTAMPTCSELRQFGQFQQDFWVINKPLESAGGDFYDVFQIDKTLYGVLIGDMTGHGIQAAYYSNLLKTLPRSFGMAVMPSVILEKMHTILKKVRKHATILYGILDTHNSTFQLAHSGEIFLALVRGKKSFSSLLYMGDITQNFIHKLIKTSDNLSHYLKMQIEQEAEIQEALAEYELKQVFSDTLSQKIANILNNTIKTEQLWKRIELDKFRLSQKTKELINEQPDNGEKLILANRFILQDYYPDGIIKNPKNGNKRTHIFDICKGKVGLGENLLYATKLINLEPNDVLVLVTDGLLEASRGELDMGSDENFEHELPDLLEQVDPYTMETIDIAAKIENKFNGSPLFHSDDINDKFLNALDNSMDGMADYLKLNMESEFKQYITNKTLTPQLQKIIAKKLNNILKTKQLWNEVVVDTEKLSKEAKYLIKATLHDNEKLTRANRLILEAYYPREISKSQNFKQHDDITVLCLKYRKTPM